eukprot:m.233643 g.233643  ORF g.233643 m.233643 type:complete len:52 (+) comp40093_c0_seq7:891-1046(+)
MPSIHHGEDKDIVDLKMTEIAQGRVDTPEEKCEHYRNLSAVLQYSYECRAI